MAIKNKEVLYARLGDKKNVMVIDPNRVLVDDDTNAVKYVEDRTVPQEDLVMYAGLKAFTKGRNSIFDDSSTPTIIDFGEITVNFLNPKETLDTYKNFFTTQWTDVFTDQNAANQVLDPETFGIKSIEITQNASLVPRIKIDFIDVRGKTLMERGDNDNNPYNLFYSLPYPSFLLTVKGYYGKAMTFPLVLLKTNTRFDPSTGDYYLSCEFLARTFSIFNDFVLAYALAAPFMFPIADQPGTYEGMEILKELYRVQNLEILAESKEKGLNLESDEVKLRLIETPITIYDLIKSADKIYNDELVQFSDPQALLNYEARTFIDEVKVLFEGTFEKVHDLLGSTELNINNVDNDPAVQLLLHDINELYRSKLIGSENSIVKAAQNNLQNKLATNNLLQRNNDLVSVTMLKKQDNGKTILSTDTLDKVMGLLEDELFKNVYSQTTEKIETAQRKIIRDTIHFDPNMENVVRILMNNMQTFLMLLNLYTSKAFEQIDGDSTRKNNQRKSGEYYVAPNGKEQLYPWPNYYTVDQKDHSGETHQREYPGIKSLNTNWPEIQFIEEIYQSFDRIYTPPAEKATATVTRLISPFLNVSALEQYSKVEKVNNTVELFKKSVLSLVHDGILFRDFKNPKAISNITDALVSYDFANYKDSLSKLSGTKSFTECRFISDAFLTTQQPNLYQNMKAKFASKVGNITQLNKLIKEEEGAFLSGNLDKLKAATKNLVENGQPKYITDIESYESKLYVSLSKETNSLDFVNPGTTSVGIRSPKFDESTASSNKKYITAPFPGIELIDGKHPLRQPDYDNGPNLTKGFYGSNENALVLEHEAFDKHPQSNTFNNIPVLTFNNIVNDNVLSDQEKLLIEKYSDY